MPSLPNPNTYWVIPGRFLAGEYPRDAAEESSRTKLLAYLREGVTFFIDLTEPGESGLRPYETILRQLASDVGNEVVYERWPIRDCDVPERDHMRRILETIDGALSDGHSVYVHCWGGVGRTGTVVATYLVEHGQSAEDALAQLAVWWKAVEKHTRQPRSPENDRQEEFVRSWMK